MYPKEELRALQQQKQNDRKKFDEDPENEKRLVYIRDTLKHNYERSQEMFASIQSVGLGDSVETVDSIISNLLSVGAEVTVDTGPEQSSVINAPKGQLKLESKWKELPDGTKYLTTVIVVPIPKEG